MDKNNVVQLRGPPTPIISPKPTTAQLKTRKKANQREQQQIYDDNAFTFAGNLTSFTLSGFLFTQTNSSVKVRISVFLFTRRRRADIN
tara:strand:+ start:181 stop:444 length:264 start_codon:yes stop_codon:yes gene_type:complete